MEKINKDKYSNGRPIDMPNDKDELEIAIKEWSEGNANLENAIRKCIENGVKTLASCAGHDDNSYLAIKITEKTRKKVYSILNKVFQNKNKISMVNIQNSIDEHFQYISSIAIHPKTNQKNKIFDLIAEGAKEEIALEQCQPIVQKLMEVELGGEQLGLSYNSISFNNIGPIKAVVLTNNTMDINKEIYNIAGIKHSINLCLTESQALNKLDSIAKAMRTRFKDIRQNSQEFIEKKQEYSWDLTNEQKEEATSRDFSMTTKNEKTNDKQEDKMIK